MRDEIEKIILEELLDAIDLKTETTILEAVDSAVTRIFPVVIGETALVLSETETENANIKYKLERELN